MTRASPSTDGITSDPTITGVVDDPSGVSSFQAALDGGGMVDVTSLLTGVGFTFTAADLATINGGTPIIDSARRRIAADSLAAEPYGNRASHGRIFYGWYIRSRTTKKTIWYGFLPRAWARHGLSPLWAQVTVSTSWSRQRLLQALRGLHEVGQAGMFEDGAESFLIPLTIPEFAGKDEVVDSLRSQLESVISRLDGVVPAGEHVAPDEPEIDNTDETE